jgi:uncharacterized protein with beta-barrel porin domain
MSLNGGNKTWQEYRLAGQFIADNVHATLGWRHAFGDTMPLSTQAFAGSDAFTVAGVPFA